jgi:hypothetical protein
MEDDYSVEKVRISKLTGPNYRSWSIQVKRLLVSRRLWAAIGDTPPVAGIVTMATSVPTARILAEATASAHATTTTVEGVPSGRSSRRTATEGVPTGSSSAGTRGPTDPGTGNIEVPGDPGSAIDEVLDAKASTLIMGMCGPEPLGHILLLEHASEQWYALKALYAPLGLQQLGAKSHAFITYKPSEGHKTIAEVANDLTTLQADIGLISRTEMPTDSLKISVFFKAIRAMDDRYDALILQLEISNSSTNFSTIVAHLTEAERRMSTSSATAFSAQTRSFKPKFKGKCYNCDKVGHRKADCRSTAKPKNAEGFKTKSKREDKPSTGPLITPGGRRDLSPDVETSWMATTGSKERAYSISSVEIDSSKVVWVIDSGASRHMTHCKESFSEYHSLPVPIVVTTASGSTLKAIGQGTIPLQVALESGERIIALTEVLYVPGLAGALYRYYSYKTGALRCVLR